MLRMGRTSTPGWCMSTMNIVRPLCLGASGLVRASSRPKRDRWADDVQIFWPFTIHSSPSRSARVASPATSEPAPGSLNSWHQISSDVKIGRRKRRRCSSVPRTTMVGPHMPMPMALRIQGYFRPAFCNALSTISCSFGDGVEAAVPDREVHAGQAEVELGAQERGHVVVGVLVEELGHAAPAPLLRQPWSSSSRRRRLVTSFRPGYVESAPWST